MNTKFMIGWLAVVIVGPLSAQVNEPSSTPTNDQTVITSNTAPAAEALAQLSEPAAEPTSIKVIVHKHQTIEEYREKGELVLVKVIPNDGIPYFIDPLERDNMQGSGKDILNSGVKPVRWVLKEF